MRVIVCVLALVAGEFGFADSPEKKDLPEPLPEKIVKAWKDAGAIVGWMKMDPSGSLSFIEKPEAGAIPAFQFPKWKDGIVSKLPAPEAPFGLYLAMTDLTDDALTELAKLKNLVSVCLCDTKASAEGVEKLQKALPKCYIFYC